MGGSQYLVKGKSHYERNRQSYIDKSRRRRKEILDYVTDIKKQSRCVDCGNDDYRVLDFDHIQGEKDINIALAVTNGWSKKRIDNEIAKCETRCANCHRIRHFELRGISLPLKPLPSK